MKTVVFKVNALSHGYSTRNVTTGDYMGFVGRMNYYKNEILSKIKPMLQRAGFIYGSDLWQFEVKKGIRDISVWVTMIFEDTNNEGKAILMKKINQTGLLNYGKIIKSYG